MRSTAGLANIRRNYQGALRKGTLTEASLAQRLALITPTLEYDAASRCRSGHRGGVRKHGREAPGVRDPGLGGHAQGAILASNTSALNLDEIANFTKRPQDVIGLHFFSPANVMRLLEVVRGAKTAKDVLATAMRLAKTMGKIAVVSGVCDGFIGNRMLARYGAAAHDLIMAGAHAATGRRGAAGVRHGDGPVSRGRSCRPRYRLGAAQAPRRRISRPRFLQCSGCAVRSGPVRPENRRGLVSLQAGSRDPIPDPKVTSIIENTGGRRGITPRTVSNQEIVERCIYALINEGARILEDGIAQRSSDIDLVYLNGYGFPAYRGGPMFYADQTGLHDIARALKRIAAGPAAMRVFWTPAPLLTRLAEQARPSAAYKGSTQ